MKLMLVAGAPSVGKTAIVKRVIGNLRHIYKIAYFKIDIFNASEDMELTKEFGIPTNKIYSGEMCPDHTEVVVLKDAINWANGSDLLIVESAGLCLRCSPYVNQGLGVVVLSAISGIHATEKMGAIVSLADVAIITHIDLVSQAEREITVQKLHESHLKLNIIETNALYGSKLQRLCEIITNSNDITLENLRLKGNPPLGVCTICIGKKEIGHENHFGATRKLSGDIAEYSFKGE